MRRSVIWRPNLSCRFMNRYQAYFKRKSLNPYAWSQAQTKKRAFSSLAPFQAGGPAVSSQTLSPGCNAQDVAPAAVGFLPPGTKGRSLPCQSTPSRAKLQFQHIAPGRRRGWPAECDTVFATPCGSSFSAPSPPALFSRNYWIGSDIPSGTETAISSALTILSARAPPLPSPL